MCRRRRRRVMRRRRGRIVRCRRLPGHVRRSLVVRLRRRIPYARSFVHSLNRSSKRAFNSTRRIAAPNVRATGAHPLPTSGKRAAQNSARSRRCAPRRVNACARTSTRFTGVIVRPLKFSAADDLVSALGHYRMPMDPWQPVHDPPPPAGRISDAHRQEDRPAGSAWSTPEDELVPQSPETTPGRNRRPEPIPNRRNSNPRRRNDKAASPMDSWKPRCTRT